MANRLLQTLAEGYCCTQRFLEVNVIGRDRDDAAEALGVTKRTITNYYSRYRDHAIYACPRCRQRRAVREEEEKRGPTPGRVLYQYPGAKED